MRRQYGHINTEYADTNIRPTILCQPPTLTYELLYVREIIGIKLNNILIIFIL